jgi:hypothetical protein
MIGVTPPTDMIKLGNTNRSRRLPLSPLRGVVLGFTTRPPGLRRIGAVPGSCRRSRGSQVPPLHESGLLRVPSACFGHWPLASGLLIASSPLAPRLLRKILTLHLRFTRLTPPVPEGRRSQVVRQGSAKPSFVGSIPTVASRRCSPALAIGRPGPTRARIAAARRTSR